MGTPGGGLVHLHLSPTMLGTRLAHPLGFASCDLVPLVRDQVGSKQVSIPELPLIVCVCVENQGGKKRTQTMA